MVVLLDDNTRPKGPTFENLTPAQKAPGRHLKMFHDHFRQNMTVLRNLIAEAERGELSAADLKARADALPITENYRRFGAICGQHCQMIHGHHSIEDAHIFPEISAKAAAFQKVVDRLVAEHEVVHALLLELIATLNTLIKDPTSDNFKSARETYDTLEKVLLSHFGYEEDSIGDALGVYQIAV